MTSDRALALKILDVIDGKPLDYGAYDDLFSILREIGAIDGLDLIVRLRERIGLTLPLVDGVKDLERFYQLYRRSLLLASPVDLDSYLLYLEQARGVEERFYQPRRGVLLSAVRELQRLVDDDLDELFISMPPRCGKTTLLLMFVTWILGRDSERSNLYSAFSDTVTRPFYNGVLEIIQDRDTYLWRDVFPISNIVQTNANDETLNVNRRKRYPSLTCRSLYGTLNGACDSDGFLISDDLISGIEEAMSKDRLVTAWDKVDNNLLTRAKEGAKILWCGTRWSMYDPIGVRIDTLETSEAFRDRRYAVINLPALDEEDESNFDYDFGVGFSTRHFRQRRASFERNNDLASWNAQYMGEPIEREGALFTPDDFVYYNGELPEGEPDRVFMAVDPAFGGGDYVAAPVCFQYGEMVYVHDVVYDNNDKRVTQPLLAQAVVKYNVHAMQVEANKSTESYKEGVEELLRDRGYRLNITTKSAPSNTAKYQRIFDKAPDLRDYFIFREEGKRSKAYQLFMQNVFSYTMFGKNKNDDAPDSLSMAADMVRNPGGRVEIFKRLF